MLAIVNGRVIIGSSVESKVVLIEDGIILDVCTKVPSEAEILDAEGLYVAPGFIDIHIHGCNGRDIMIDTYESVINISRYLLNTGVTAFLGTTMTQSGSEIRQVLKEAKRASKETTGADLLGIHMEGPFICHQYRGAQNEKYVQKPSIEGFREICGDNEDFIKIVTLAPELEGAHELIEYLNDRGIVSSMGHTGASYEEAMKGIQWGLKSSAHTFNGMRGFSHREPGALGAVMDSDIMAECIADGIHVHPTALRILAKQKNLDNIILVTDCMMGGGLEDGQYNLGDQRVFVNNGVATLKEGQLAGSTLSMNSAVRNIVSYIGITIPQAIMMATANPARLLELKDRGKIEKGYLADIIMFDEDIYIRKVIKSGSQRL